MAINVEDEIEFCFFEAKKRFKFLLDLGFRDAIPKSGGLWGSLLYRGDKVTISVQFELLEFFVFFTVCPAGKEGWHSQIHLVEILQQLYLDQDYDNKLRALRGDLKNCGEFLDIYVFALRENFTKIIENFDLIFIGK